MESNFVLGINIMKIINQNVKRARLMSEALVNNNATGVAFAGYSYDQFLSGIAPSFDKREEYAESLMRAVGHRQEIDNADGNTAKIVTRTRDAIRSHPDYGPNSALYVQCGYVADNQKRSGLTRNNNEDAPPPSGVAPSDPSE
jgi:hypothetical protein